MDMEVVVTTYILKIYSDISGYIQPLCTAYIQDGTLSLIMIAFYIYAVMHCCTYSALASMYG